MSANPSQASSPLPRPARGAMPPPSRVRRRYSRGSMLRRRWLIRATKWLLPVGALLLLSAIALWPEIEGTEERARLSFRRMSQVGADVIRVVAPRYQGVDSQNRAFDVTADVAMQPSQDAPIALEEPRGDIFLSGGAWMMVESTEGLYDRGAEVLNLTGDVRLWHDNGTTMRTTVATVQVKQGSAQGDQPVAAQGAFGTIVGEGFRLEDGGKLVIFTGRTRAMLEGER